MWGTQQQSAFEELVHALISGLFLQMPQFDEPYIVHIYASDVAIGTVLMQKVDEITMPVCYYSKQLNETKAHWSIYVRELYAIVQALGMAVLFSEQTYGCIQQS